MFDVTLVKKKVITHFRVYTSKVLDNLISKSKSDMLIITPYHGDSKIPMSYDMVVINNSIGRVENYPTSELLR